MKGRGIDTEARREDRPVLAAVDLRPEDVDARRGLPGGGADHDSVTLRGYHRGKGSPVAECEGLRLATDAGRRATSDEKGFGRADGWSEKSRVAAPRRRGLIYVMKIGGHRLVAGSSVRNEIIVGVLEFDGTEGLWDRSRCPRFERVSVR